MYLGFYYVYAIALTIEFLDGTSPGLWMTQYFWDYIGEVAAGFLNVVGQNFVPTYGSATFEP